MTVPGWLRDRRAWVVLGGVGLGVAGYGAGRYAAPTKVEERERVVERLVVDEKTVEARVAAAKVTWEKDIQDHSETRVIYKDGKVVERIVYRDRDTHSEGTKVEVKTVEVVREVKVEVLREVEREKIVTRDAPRLTIGATVGWAGVPTYGAFAGVRILGPLTLLAQGEGGAGVWSARAGVGLQF